MKKLTFIKVTPEFVEIEKRLLEKTGLSKAAFHRKALEHFLEGSMEIDPDLRITERTNPAYVKRTEREGIYLTDDMRERLKEVAQEKGIKYTVLTFQALLNYCVYMVEYFPEVGENL